MADTDSKKVIIIGAGTTGLALAQGLKKAAVPFAIYERAPSSASKRNWCFGLHWGIEPLAKLVPEHLLQNIAQCQVDPHIELTDEHFRMPLADAKTGKHIKNLEGSKFYRFRRDKFRHLLLEDLDVQYGKEISAITFDDDSTRVTARFGDGSHDTGSLVVGCDGSRSAVRTLLLGFEKAALVPVGGYATAMIYANYSREHALALRAPPFHPLYQVGMHPDGYLCWFSLHDGDDKDHPENWKFFQYISYEAPPGHADWSKQQLVAYQKQLAQKFGEPWKSAYEWISDDETEVWNTEIRDWDPRKPENEWDNHSGRVTLAGDSAHPMSFQRGQGLNNAVQDAYELFTAIRSFTNGGGAQAAAIDAYEAEMKARGGKEVQMSRENTIMMHSKSQKDSHLVKQGMKKQRPPST
ncbi:unnamed protein product [Cercospora beticola]|nr:unnamed protein product [Cercospora beticola]